MDDEGEVHRGRVDAVVQQALGDVHGGAAGGVLQVLEGHDELVHTGPGVGHGVFFAQALHHVVGVEDRVSGRLGDALPAQGEDVGQGLHHHGEVAVKILHPADGMFGRGQMIPRLILCHHRSRQEAAEELLAAHRAGAGAAAAVGGGEGLVEVQVDHVEAHVAGADHPHDRVEIGPVVVAQAPRVVDDPGDLQDVPVKNPHRVGVGQHQTGGVRPHGAAQGLHIHAAVFAGGDVHHREARHDGGGRIGAVGGVGDDDLGPGGVVPPGVVRLDEQQAGELAVGPGGGLEGHGVHAGDLPQELFGFVENLQTALDRLLGLEGVNLGEQGGHVLVDLGVVLHGAGAQGVEAVVHPVDPLGQGRVVAGQLRLGDVGQVQGLRPGTGEGDLRHVAGGHQGQVLAGSALFKNQLHVSTPP